MGEALLGEAQAGEGPLHHDRAGGELQVWWADHLPLSTCHCELAGTEGKVVHDQDLRGGRQRAFALESTGVGFFGMRYMMEENMADFTKLDLKGVALGSPPLGTLELMPLILDLRSHLGLKRSIGVSPKCTCRTWHTERWKHT